MKKKLLLVGAFPSENLKIYGGIVTCCRALLSSSFSSRYDLELIDSTQISNPPPNYFTRSRIAFIRFICYLSRLLTGDADLIMIFMSGSISSIIEKGIMAWLAKIFFNKPVLIFPRGGRLIDLAKASIFYKFWISKMLQGGTFFLCQGPAWQEFAIDIGYNYKNTSIIYNWTASQSLLKIGEMRDAIKSRRTHHVLFLGWLEINKGIFDLLQALLNLSPEYDFKLKIAGRGHAEGSAKKYVSQNNMDNFVEFVGWVDDEAKHLVLAEADILVLPSWAEGFPNVIIEAMAAKVAVVVSAVGNIPGIIDNNNQALLVQPKNPLMLQKALGRLFDDTHFCNSLAHRGHVFAKNNFSVEPAVEKLSTIIDSAC